MGKTADGQNAQLLLEYLRYRGLNQIIELNTTDCNLNRIKRSFELESFKNTYTGHRFFK